MNIKEYISSGIIESYVLGLASPEERAEFEAYCAQYPELVAARDEFEAALEQQLMDRAISPPAGIKEKLMLTIQDIPGSNSKLIAMPTETNRKPVVLRFVAAASIILLLGAAYFAYDFYNENKKLKKEKEEFMTKVDSLQQLKDFQESIQGENVITVNLTATTPVKASANVFWDSTSSDVYMVVKNLPKLPSEKQYQLWSIINGADGSLQPNSMGLFDVGDDGKVILKMPAVKKADAFAITVEDRGNKGGPNLEQLKAMGKTGL